MTQLLDQEEINLIEEMYPETTQRIKAWFAALVRDMELMEKVKANADDVKKVWELAQQIDRRQQDQMRAEIRATAAYLSTLKKNTGAVGE